MGQNIFARVRPFGTVDIFENKMYIQTGKTKNVSKQIHSSPQIEICGMADGKWIRVEAAAIEDDNVEARKHMLDAYPELQKMYSAYDGNTEVFYLKDAIATISSFTEAPVTIKF